MNGIVALKQARKYMDNSFAGAGAVKGQDGLDGFSPVIVENPNNSGDVYKLDITNKNGKFITPNLKGESGNDGTDGVSIMRVSKVSTSGLIDTYHILFSDGTHYEYNVKNGEQGLQGIQGIPGAQGEPGVDGRPGIQGKQGEKGDDGWPFLIYKEYASLADFNAADFPQVGLLFALKTSNNVVPLYRYTGDTNTPYSYLTSLEGAQSIKGETGAPGRDGEQGIPGRDGQDGTTYTPTIGTITTVETDMEVSASVVTDKTAKTASFSFAIPRGRQGIAPHIGENGNWFIGEVDTGIPAQGAQGIPGTQGTPGTPGQDGATFTPSVSAEGMISWTNDKNLPNPP